MPFPIVPLCQVASRVTATGPAEPSPPRRCVRRRAGEPSRALVAGPGARRPRGAASGVRARRPPPRGVAWAHVPCDLSACCRATAWSSGASTISGSATRRRRRAGGGRPARARRTSSSRGTSCWRLRGHSECCGRVGRPRGAQWCPGTAFQSFSWVQSLGPQMPAGQALCVCGVLGAGEERPVGTRRTQEDPVPAWATGRQRVGRLLAEGSAEGSGGWEHGPGRLD